METNNYHHDNLQERLIDAGIEVLNSEGYKNFSLRKVAKRCNVSHSAPYRHFSSKEDLINAIFNKAFAEFASSLQASVADNSLPAKQQLKKLGLAYVEFFIKNPQYLHILFSQNTNMMVMPLVDTHNSKCSPHLSKENPFSILQNTVYRYLEVNKDNEMSKDEAIVYYWSLVHGLATLLSSSKTSDDITDLLSSAEKILEKI